MVDSSSIDGSVGLIRKKFPKVRVIELKENIGVAGYNVGMQKAKGDYFVIVDCDATINKSASDLIVRVFDNCEADILAFKILNFETGKLLDNPAHDTYGSREYGYETAYFNGSAWAIRREVFEACGGYNPEYFIYLAEIDLSIKAIQRGFNLKYFPDLVCRHKISPPNKRGKGKYYVSRNWVYFIVQYLPLWVVPIFIIWSAFKVVYDTTKGYGLPGSYFQGCLDGLKEAPYYWKKRKTLTYDQTKLFMKTNFVTGGFTKNF